MYSCFKNKDKFNKRYNYLNNNNIGKASARSTIGFDIGSAIIAATQEKILLKGGGHKMAGGFSIKIENIEMFKNLFTKNLQTKMKIL